MRFLYRFQDKEGLHDGELAAASLADAYSDLRKRGIRPMKVWPKPGLINRLFIGKRWIAIIMLAAVVVALLLRSPESVPEDTGLLPLPRQQLAAVQVAFAHPSEALLARFARPGVPVALDEEELDDPAFAADFVAALKDPIQSSADDSAAAIALKRVVVGLKDEARVALDSGETPALVMLRLIERQKMEVAYRDGLKTEVSLAKGAEARAAKLQAANANLRIMGLPEITEKDF